MKKLIVILSCVLLLAAVTLTSVFATAGSASLAASTPTVEAGSTVTVTLSVTGYGSSDMLTVQGFAAPEGMELLSGEWLLSGGTTDINLSGLHSIYFNMGNKIDLTGPIDLIRFTYKANEPAVGAQDLKKTITMNLLGVSEQVVPVSVEVTVVKSATSLSLAQSLAIDLSGTTTAQLTATYGPENTTDKLTWDSDNKQVATVDANGLVTGLTEGTANITATIGNLTKTCRVTVACGHTTKTAHNANEPTCQSTGNNKYYTCNTCSDVFKADQTTATTVAAETLATVGHKGGTATCSAQAVCQWCTQPYGNTLPHTFTQRIEDAAHLVAGSGADCQHVKRYYYDCADCTAISSADIFDSTTVGDHSMDPNWTAANGQHYHKCTVTGCTYKEDEGTCSGGTATCLNLAVCGTCSNPYGQLAACNFTPGSTDATYRKSEATCKDLAVYYYSCTVCGAKDTSQTFTSGALNPSNHAGGTEVRDARPEDCGNKGYTGDTWCKGCNTITQPGSDIQPTGNHTGGTATCSTQAVCGTCGQSYGPLKPHAYSAQWTSTGTADTDSHYQLCTTCQVAKDKEGTHTFTWVTDDPATEDKTGLEHEECITCKVKRNEGTVIEKLPHQHVGIQRHPAVAATCVATGNKEYWTCSSPKCTGKYFGDADCATELPEITTAINPDNHPGTEVRDYTAANCYQDGYSGDTYCTAVGCQIQLAPGTTLPATGNHVADTQWFNEGDKHWHICTTTGCGAKVGEATHSYTWKLDEAATEDKTGLKHEECVCGVKRNEGTVIDKLDHVHVGIKHFAAVKATCVKAGTVEYWTCSSHKCTGKYYGDDKCQLVLETIVEAINKDNHTGGTTLKDAVAATCSENGYSGDTYCKICTKLIKKGEVIAATGKHTPADGYQNDDKQHWQVCAHCGQINGYRKEDHTYTWVVDQYPTESATGSKHQKCTACGYTCNAGTVIDKLVHSPALVDGKAPTCTEDGVLKHYMCSNCGGYYSSVDGQIGDAITKEDTVLAATGHAFGTQWLTSQTEHWHECACGETAEKAAHTTEVVGAKDATETETGYTGDTVCSVCEYVVAEGEEIPVLETEAPTEPTEPTEEPEPDQGVNPIVWIVSAVGVAAVAAAGVFLGLKKKRSAK